MCRINVKSTSMLLLLKIKFQKKKNISMLLYFTCLGTKVLQIIKMRPLLIKFSSYSKHEMIKTFYFKTICLLNYN